MLTGNNSIVFHTSSCSEAEPTAANGKATGLHLSVSEQCDPIMSSQRLSGCPLDPKIHKSLTPLPPSTAFEGEQADTQQDRDCHDTGLYGRTTTRSSVPPAEQGSGTVDLSNPSIQMEIVQMRDELKRFHELKMHRKRLEARLTAGLRQGSSEAVTEVHSSTYHSLLLPITVTNVLTSAVDFAATRGVEGNC